MIVNLAFCWRCGFCFFGRKQISSNTFPICFHWIEYRFTSDVEMKKAEIEMTRENNRSNIKKGKSRGVNMILGDFHWFIFFFRLSSEIKLIKMLEKYISRTIVDCKQWIVICNSILFRSNERPLVWTHANAQLIHGIKYECNEKITKLNKIGRVRFVHHEQCPRNLKINRQHREMKFICYSHFGWPREMPITSFRQCPKAFIAF